MKGKINQRAIDQKRYAYLKRLASLWFNNKTLKSKMAAYNAYRYLYHFCRSDFRSINQKYVVGLKLSWPELVAMRNYFMQMFAQMRKDDIEKRYDAGAKINRSWEQLLIERKRKQQFDSRQWRRKPK